MEPASGGLTSDSNLHLGLLDLERKLGLAEPGGSGFSPGIRVWSLVTE